MTAQNQASTAVAKKEEKAVEFVPFGAKDSIRLTASMVRQFIAVPTRSGALPSERDCIRFIMLARGKRANPFEGDCFLIGYDTQIGPAFSLVCGIELFLKRAEASTDYDGKESGAIVLRDGAAMEVPGAFILPSDKLLGGWAKVYRKGRRMPEYKTVKLDVYDTGRSRWAKDAPGMIAKVAESQALRSAYPTALGGLYTAEEMERVTETGTTIADRAPVNMPEVIESEDAPAKSTAATEHRPDESGEAGAAGTDGSMPRAEIERIISTAPKGAAARALAKRDLTAENWREAGEDILREVAEILLKGKT